MQEVKIGRWFGLHSQQQTFPEVSLPSRNADQRAGSSNSPRSFISVRAFPMVMEAFPDFFAVPGYFACKPKARPHPSKNWIFPLSE
jgi:hypothetical protein